MSVYLRGNTWWYAFDFGGVRVQASAKTKSKTVAKEAEKQRRRELEMGYNGIADQRAGRIRNLSDVAEDYLADYRLRHKSITFAEHSVGHLLKHLGNRMVSSIGEADVVEYQNTRLKARAANKSINEEVGFLLRILGESGDSLRLRLKRARKLKLAVRERVGRALTLAERDALLEVARKRRSPHIVPAILLSIDAGLRDSEIKGLQWGRIDFDRRVVTVGKSKTQAGEGRTVPMSEGVYAALTDHARWFTDRFGVMLPEHYCFPFGRPQPTDPTRPVQTFKTAWKMVKEDAGVKARFHDGRHTFVTELAEAGASDEVIRSTVGHVSSQMIRHYSHIRTEAKRRGIAAIEELRQVRREQEKARLTAVELEVSSTLSTTLN